MKYMGSKKRLQKHLTPIIQSYIDSGNNIDCYIEPFVGGANMIESIRCYNKNGYDNNKYLIALLDYVSTNGLEDLPKIINREHYVEVRDSYNKKDKKYEDYYTGYIGFMASYNGKFFDGGYSGHSVSVGKKGKIRDYIRESIDNLSDQVSRIKDTMFIHADYSYADDIKNAVIYCDPPYKGTTKYMTSKNFNHEEFYDWCRKMSKDNIVLISEYDMPDDFTVIWEKKMKTSLMNVMGGIRKSKVERLFIVK